MNLNEYEKEIIIDVDCAAAVLRGAHIYAPGVMGMMSGSQIGDKVSIYADMLKKCKRGLQKRLSGDGEKLFIGNGVVKMQRHQLFAENLYISGVAIEVVETISGCPPIGDNLLPSGWALLQNLPSGLLVAIDKTPNKVAKLRARCDQFGAAVLCFQADSTKLVATDAIQGRPVTDGPPFLSGSFDRVLLDAPCSVLGKRPQLVNRLSENEIKSYVPLQRKLFETAVKLLKVNGTLVYSTCTITLSENEGIVAWALNKFDCLELVKPDLALSGPGWVGTSLTEDQIAKVQRFGPDQSVDSVGFFFACFIKKH
ncbi:unnamed protein product [Phaedon cochleariae]|nr:unnamed protein product [Phaedon cochleariae]